MPSEVRMLAMADMKKERRMRRAKSERSGVGNEISRAVASARASRRGGQRAIR